ncbi:MULTISPECIES: N-formylglutamate deformylase [unclassified Wenzhouxiangella]|uniref:N-formylglutamate deformylase n=1 Tax=unclassified Wenzhouxiangella TaxID=2613841 RepID=UPI000E32CC7E|nr:MULTISPECIES: N-formylglutamate deformylase [unclassified Wenzhouxiangella]RFF28530.1 N-formylglutamate deformylase [Wenzhouxiangella sp. 15181]RFP70048.1 N-formylglutamate deformylase [Wenzhouxiangella sp. 15190]
MLYDFHAGTGALLVNVPHAGVEVPQSIESRMSDRARALPDTDWHVHRLVEDAAGPDVSVLSARYSRYVIDLNRGRDDQPLYAGATTGLVPTETFDGDPVYRDRNPDDAEVSERIERYWQPYHDKLRETLEGLKQRHGYAVLFDVHSIRSTVPRLFDGRLPDLNLGTYEGRSCNAQLQAQVAEVLAGADGFSTVVNGRFKGGFITRHYGQPAEGIHALQLEIAQACYMDESRPREFDPDRARPLVTVLARLIDLLSQWRPA